MASIPQGLGCPSCHDNDIVATDVIRSKLHGVPLTCRDCFTPNESDRTDNFETGQSEGK